MQNSTNQENIMSGATQHESNTNIEKPLYACDSPTHDEAPTAFPIMKLPLELRTIIYHTTFTYHTDPSDYLRLLQTCHETYHIID